MPKKHAILIVKDVNGHLFNRQLAKQLKKGGEASPPEWIDCVKSGYSRELPPNNPDWYYVRMASIGRKIYLRCPQGVGGLARSYGNKNTRRGVRPGRKARGARKICRHALQEYEKMGFMKKAERGRRLTKKGRKFFDDFSRRLRRSRMVNEYYTRKREINNPTIKRKDRHDGGGGGVTSVTTYSRPMYGQGTPPSDDDDVEEVEDYN
eukprot:UN03757